MNEKMLREDETLEELQPFGLKLLQKKEGFRFGMDSVLLADFAGIRTDDLVADFGTGSGVLPLLLIGRKKGNRFIGVEIQQDIAFEKAASRKGLVLDCMVIGRLPEEGVTVMRSYMDAPDIDGFVFAESDNEFVSGTMLTVRITGSEGYDLYGEIV